MNRPQLGISPSFAVWSGVLWFTLVCNAAGVSYVLRHSDPRYVYLHEHAAMVRSDVLSTYVPLVGAALRRGWGDPEAGDHRRSHRRAPVHHSVARPERAAGIPLGDGASSAKARHHRFGEEPYRADEEVVWHTARPHPEQQPLHQDVVGAEAHGARA